MVKMVWFIFINELEKFGIEQRPFYEFVKYVPRPDNDCLLISMD